MVNAFRYSNTICYVNGWGLIGKVCKYPSLNMAKRANRLTKYPVLTENLPARAAGCVIEVMGINPKPY